MEEKYSQPRKHHRLTADRLVVAEEDEYYSILDYMRRHGKFINRR